MRYSQKDSHAYHHERLKRELSPCPGRTGKERQYITRRLYDIADSLDYHLSRLAINDEQPPWLPEAVITPAIEAQYVESKDAFENTTRDEDGYITDMHNHNQRATNRVRVASWYRNDDQNLYMTALIAVSPLPCDEWGALPLTLAQWRIIIPQLTITHMQWKWLHAVRKFWSDDTYQVGGSFGWYMETCKKLDKDYSQLWTGQAIYSHVVRVFSEHVQQELDTPCQP